MAKVLIADKMSPRAAEIFKKNKVEVDVTTGLTPEELTKIIGNYDGIAIRSSTKLTPELISAAKNLKVIGRAGIGVDNVNIPAATAQGVIVMNTPFGNSVTTAEHAITMMMSLARDIPQASASTHAGKWEKSKFMGVEVTGKTLGVIGCGNIGAIVIDRAKGLRMNVIGFDPYLSEERASDMGIEKVELDTLFERADFITLHTPLTDGTRGIINADAFAKMKDGVRIINCARGGLVDEAALKVAIESGKVAGAALDVFEVEPAKENPLFGMEQIICTPHLGASTEEAQENVALQVAEQIADYLNNNTVTNALNMPSVSAEEAKKLEPYIQLGSQLGGFAGQLTENGIKSVKIEYEGAVAELNTKPITATLLMGLLRPLVDSVNMVNAPVVAKERNIDIAEVKHERPGDYQTLIKLTVTTDKQERSITGTLFGGSRPRLVEVNGVALEAELGEFMLFINNEDKPGLIGDVGKVLGDANVNIANFHLGRGQQKNDAIALVHIDSKIDEKLLQEIENLSSVKQAKLLQF
jgi:D-3-phosphoglycerate dehydrogenase